MDTHNAFVLADGTGAGKTAQMLTVAEHYSRAGEDVLIVVDTEKTFREAFVRDAKMLGIPVNKLNFIPAKKDTSKIGKMSKGKINVIAYNYFSLGNVQIISKLGTVPNLVIFDEAHNLKNVLQTTGEATK